VRVLYSANLLGTVASSRVEILDHIVRLMDDDSRSKQTRVDRDTREMLVTM